MRLSEANMKKRRFLYAGFYCSIYLRSDYKKGKRPAAAFGMIFRPHACPIFSEKGLEC